MATKMQKKKINSSEATLVMKLKLCRIISDISLDTKILFLLPLLKHFGCYSISFFTKPLDFIDCYGNQKVKLGNKF